MAKYTTYQATLGYSLASPFSSYTTIAQIKKIGEIPQTRGEVDVTTLDSPNNFEEVLTTLKRSGTVPLELVYDASLASHAALKTLYDNGNSASYKVTFASGTTAIFLAFMKDYALGELTPEGAQMAKAGLRITGAITIA